VHVAAARGRRLVLLGLLDHRGLRGEHDGFSPASRVSESRYVEQLPNGDLLVTWVIWVN